jgi:hypothetical protein
LWFFIFMRICGFYLHKLTGLEAPFVQDDNIRPPVIGPAFGGAVPAYGHGIGESRRLEAAFLYPYAGKAAEDADGTPGGKFPTPLSAGIYRHIRLL